MLLAKLLYHFVGYTLLSFRWLYSAIILLAILSYHYVGYTLLSFCWLFFFFIILLAGPKVTADEDTQP